MKKLIITEKQYKKLKKKINEQAFNDAGEPMMTHSQFRDYSEPSEPDYDDREYGPEMRNKEVNFDTVDWQVVYDMLAANTEKENCEYNIGDFEEYALNSDELFLLKDGDTNVWYDDNCPYFDTEDGQVPPFEMFKAKVDKLWEKIKNGTYQQSNYSRSNDSEEPYMRGRELYEQKYGKKLLQEQFKKFSGLKEQDSSQDPNEIINGFNDFPPFGHADEQDPSENIEPEKPDWLETLWNVNPRLAERAEEYLKEKGILGQPESDDGKFDRVV